MARMLLVALFIVVRSPSYAQFLPDLQAKTPAEYDAYLDVLDGEAIEKGTAFERQYPESALRLPVYELISRAWRARGDAGKAIESAAKGVAVAPDYVPLLVELADLLANSSRELDRAAGAAQHALELLETVRAPRAVRADEWTTAVAALRARAHGALGIVRFKKNDGAGAIKEFEQALAVDSSESPALHYRLGRLLAASGQSVKARQHLEAAVKTGGKVLRELAQAALAELP